MNGAIIKKTGNSFTYFIILVLVLSAMFLFLGPKEDEPQEVNLSTFIEQARNGEVKSIAVSDNRMDIVLKTDLLEFAFKESSQSAREILEDIPETIRNTIIVKIEDTESSSFWTNLLISIVPFLLIVAFFLFMFKQAQGSSNQALNFGKSKARTPDSKSRKTTFEDVAGANEAKEELKEIVDFLKTPGKYTALGAKIPKGVLLVGPPGCGKTLVARAVAGEAKVPFFNISGSEFVEMFVGVGASRVRDLFKKAQKNAPCIIFIDELDAVGRHRGAGMGGGHDEREQTLNQILTEMDGFEPNSGVVVMSATNRPDVLDPALLRPGRFDRRVVMDQPDIEDREKILAVHARKKPLMKNVSLRDIARQTPGFVGADLENLMNEAAILAARKNKKTISMKELEAAIEKVLLGPERKSKVLSKQEREITAYHEVGHAICAQMSPECDPVKKVSIVARGMALGVTWMVPEEDKHLYSKSKFEADLCSLLGGYAAEEEFFGQVTTGASNDLEKATGLARRMVTEFGMSDLGPVIYGEKNKEVFLGRDFGHVRNYSEEIAAKIDAEVQKFVRNAHECAKQIVKNNKPKMKEIGAYLLQKETISKKEFGSFFEK